MSLRRQLAAAGTFVILPRMESLYTETVPVFTHFLTNLLTLIQKAEVHAKKKKIKPSTYLSKRLYKNMFTFTQQVQYAYFLALDATSNLSGKKSPEFAYDEKSIAELKKSVRRTLTFLKSIKPSDLKGARQKKVPLFFDPKRKMPAPKYVRYLALPDFFFHYTICYAILRHNGVPLGKNHFIGGGIL